MAGMPENPAISVVIPTYNAARFLREALDSLVAQTFTDWEAVCVNDGSTDNSLEILQEYAAKDARFRILDGPNGGYGKAMNRGMDAARGKYMAILEPDDYLPPQAYAVLHAAAEKHGLDVARGSACFFWQDGKKRGYKYAGDDFADNMVFCPRDYPYVLHFAPKTWTGLYRMDFLRDNNIRYHETPGASYQDTGMFCFSILYARRVMLLANVVYMYRTDNPASSVNNVFGKPYAIMEELRYIRAGLEARGEVWDWAKGVFCSKVFSVLLWAYGRVGDDTRNEYLKRLRLEVGQLMDIGFEGLSDYHRRLLDSLMASTEEFNRCYEGALRTAPPVAPCVRVSCGGLVRRVMSPCHTETYVAGICLMTRRKEDVYRPVHQSERMLYCSRDVYRLMGIPVVSRIYDCHYTAVSVLGIVVQKTRSCKCRS